MVSGGDGNFQEYQIKGYNFEPLATSDAAESSSSTNLEQFSDSSSHRDGFYLIFLEIAITTTRHSDASETWKQCIEPNGRLKKCYHQ